METVKINVGKGYNVYIGAGLLDNAGALISQAVKVQKAAIITDSNVEPLYAKRLEQSLADAGIQSVIIAFPAGEENKRISTLSDILEALAENGFSRSDKIIALGGGVTGDMAGFAAGVYMRGIGYIQMPTTLLAAVDSSVGGKTAVDLKAGKNLAGAFVQPELVICDTDTLKTLPQKEISNGMAEIIKYGVLFSDELFATLEDGNAEDFTSIIKKCVELKGEIVEKDEKEQNERKLLNLGHTIGHAVEKCSGYGISHGYAVAIGMAMITRACEKMGVAENGIAQRVEKLLKAKGLPVQTDYADGELARAAMGDKKREGESITLVLPVKIGSCILQKVSLSKLEEYVREGR